MCRKSGKVIYVRARMSEVFRTCNELGRRWTFKSMGVREPFERYQTPYRKMGGDGRWRGSL